MANIKKATEERLYLDKEEKNEVYIETSLLPQHQIDGIRFLYRQFKKKKPGVIVSNPEGYGKSFQVALFLDAVRKSLINPVLILCEDDNIVNNWKQTLIKCTNFTENDIVVESTYIYVKKKIFLKKGEHLAPPYCRRDWGVVVIKSDFVLKKLVKKPIQATFKIWLTTMDMTKDLELFNSIYSWMYSEKKFDVMQYISSISGVNEPLVSLKMLTAFMEDVVITINDFIPFSSSEVIQEKQSNTTKVSRKNKDATGTKIKRSKKSIESDTSTVNRFNMDSYYNSDHTYVEPNFSTYSVTAVMDPGDDCDIKKNMDCQNFNDDEGMDVESFIREKEPVQCEEYEFLDETNSTDTENMSFTEALNDIVENENGNGDDQQNSDSILSNFNNNYEVLVLSSDTDEPISLNGNSNDKSAKDREEENNSNSSPTPVSLESLSTNGTIGNKIDKCTDSKTPDVLTEKTHKNKNNRKDAVEALSEMEEQAMKKFKGSLLDSFF